MNSLTFKIRLDFCFECGHLYDEVFSSALELLVIRNATAIKGSNTHSHFSMIFALQPMVLWFPAIPLFQPESAV